jgi:hypothetical protein
VTVAELVHWMLRICAVGVVIDAVEQLAHLRKLSDDGLYAWVILRRRLDRAPRAVRALADAACAGAIRPALVLVARIAAAAGVAAWSPGTTPADVALTVLVATQLYHFLRRAGFAIWGSDQMNLVTLGATWLGVVVDGSPDGVRAALWFIAAQSALSYFVNGAAKLVAPAWRSGRALAGVFSTTSNGDPRLHRVFAARPRLSRALCWLTMLWECAMPLALVVPDPARLAFLASGALFHLTVAATMGIHLFVWAFIAPYAAIWAVTR